jgi:hypothetical protein
MGGRFLTAEGHAMPADLESVRGAPMPAEAGMTSAAPAVPY